MLLKSADPDHPRHLEQLRALQTVRLDAFQANWLRQELQRRQAGMAGERDAAYYIDNSFKDGRNHAVIHDLRLEVDGEVAQIDHLLIARLNTFYLLETKNFNGNLVINEQGEFTVEYGATRYGIPSPLEQSRRHARVLAKLLERLGIVGRLQKLPDFVHAVLVHPKATIERPDPKRYDTSHVIKADQFSTWHERRADSAGIATALGSLMNARSSDTIREWGEKLVRQHRRAPGLQLPDFMDSAIRQLAAQARTSPSPAPPAAARPPSRPATPPPEAAAPAPQSPAPAPAPAASLATDGQPGDATAAKRLVCMTCGQKISFAEGRFCWNNAARFGGLQYCRTHQAGH